MKIGILGAGNIGKNAARHFVRAGHTVVLSNSRGPETLADFVEELGPQAEADTPAGAVSAVDIILLSVPWTQRRATYESAGGSGAFAGKIVIDATNPYTEYPALEDLGGRPASVVVAGELPGAKVVKAFNTIYFETLANDAKPPGDPARIALPVCGDDLAAKAAVCALIEGIGFAAVDAGGLADSQRQEPNQPLYDKDYTAPQLHEALKQSGL